ncbi:MAG: hypothetical protein LBD90_00430, partial [Bifidobacteriaceae bacterium]|nr:hypothetical protein [Bifidobacteriaceae bacterium]
MPAPPLPPPPAWPGAGGGGTASGKSHRALSAVVASVAALALVAGGALAIPAVRERLFGSGQSKNSAAAPTEPETTELVVNNPLNLGSSFANGHTEAWRVGQADYLSTAGDVVMTLGWPGTTHESGDPNVEFWALDQASGSTRWAYPADPEISNNCQDGLFGSTVVCSTSGGLDRANLLLEVETGQSAPVVDYLAEGFGGFEVNAYPVGGDLVVMNLNNRLGVNMLARYHSAANRQWSRDGEFGDWNASYQLSLVDGVLDVHSAWELTGSLLDWATGGTIEGCGSAWPGPLLICDSSVPETLELSDGTVARTYAAPSGSSPVLFQTGPRPPLALLMLESKLVAVDPDTAQAAWELDLGRAASDRLIGAWDGGGKVALIRGDDDSDGIVWQVDIDQGELLWTNEQGLGCEDSCSRSVHQLAGGVVAVS